MRSFPLLNLTFSRVHEQLITESHVNKEGHIFLLYKTHQTTGHTDVVTLLVERGKI